MPELTGEKAGGGGVTAPDGALALLLPMVVTGTATALDVLLGAYSTFKGLLRKAEARSPERLVETMGEAISAITPRDAERFVEHRGYRLVAQ